MTSKIELIVAQIVKQKLNSDMEIEELIETPFAMLNMNSISFIEIIVDIETKYDIEIEPEMLDVNVLKDVKSIAKYVQDIVGENEEI